MVTDREALRELEPQAVRAAIGDGSYGGPYAGSGRGRARVSGAAGVAEVRGADRAALAGACSRRGQLRRSSSRPSQRLAAGARARRDLRVARGSRPARRTSATGRAHRRRPPSPRAPSRPRGRRRGGRRSRAGGRARSGSAEAPHSCARLPDPAVDRRGRDLDEHACLDELHEPLRVGLHLGVPLRVREHRREPLVAEREQPSGKLERPAVVRASRRAGTAAAAEPEAPQLLRPAAASASRTRSRRPCRTSSGIPARSSSAPQLGDAVLHHAGVGRPVVAHVRRRRRSP